MTQPTTPLATIGRPTVQLQTPNHAQALRDHLLTSLPLFQNLPGLVGITLNGGLSRGYGDHLSEIDVTLYLTPETFTRWQTNQSPFAQGITRIDGQLYDIKVVDFAAEQSKPWSSDTLWDASYAEILYDPAQQLATLFAKRLAHRPAPAEAQGHMMSCWWYFQLAGDIWIYRGDVVQGHHLFNQAVVALLKALFIANGEWIPHEKWLFHLSRTLAWTPISWQEQLQAAMSTGDFTLDSLRQRQRVIAALWTAVDTYLIARNWPDLPVYVMQKSFYTLLQQLNQTGFLSHEAWTAAGGHSFFNLDPFHKIVTVDEQGIHLQRERLLALQPEALYAWHFAVAEAVRAGTTTRSDLNRLSPLM